MAAFSLAEASVASMALGDRGDERETDAGPTGAGADETLEDREARRKSGAVVADLERHALAFGADLHLDARFRALEKTSGDVAVDDELAALKASLDD